MAAPERTGEQHPEDSPRPSSEGAVASSTKSDATGTRTPQFPGSPSLACRTLLKEAEHLEELFLLSPAPLLGEEPPSPRDDTFQAWEAHALAAQCESLKRARLAVAEVVAQALGTRPPRPQRTRSVGDLRRGGSIALPLASRTERRTPRTTTPRARTPSPRPLAQERQSPRPRCEVSPRPLTPRSSQPASPFLGCVSEKRLRARMQKVDDLQLTPRSRALAEAKDFGSLPGSAAALETRASADAGAQERVFVRSRPSPVVDVTKAPKTSSLAEAAAWHLTKRREVQAVRAPEAKPSRRTRLTDQPPEPPRPTSRRLAHAKTLPARPRPQVSDPRKPRGCVAAHQRKEAPGLPATEKSRRLEKALTGELPAPASWAVAESQVNWAVDDVLLDLSKKDQDLSELILRADASTVENISLEGEEDESKEEEGNDEDFDASPFSGLAFRVTKLPEEATSSELRKMCQELELKVIRLRLSGDSAEVLVGPLPEPERSRRMHLLSCLLESAGCCITVSENEI